ncbi:MAG: pyridinium-3,5-bisthiocarboxylic acid mononucleotide nickel chelatase [Eubacteriales bacterium]|nr:pyridinium-3,5-bisthiocarboxylic acid mononucleotide nickel chelatase [Eubacteriales bacterium]MDN5363587.1 pyridinium-3,5-bisthiocarboxylic acid mononucleotide nickel chelatase [Eubacteriales bacterium]
MKVLYIDCPAGVSGDMLLGALIDLGGDIEKINALLQPTVPVRLEAETVNKGGIRATQVRVITEERRSPHRHLHDVLRLIEQTPFSQRVKENAARVFQLLAAAEGKIHGLPPEKVHFHEVGALDALADILATLYFIDELGVTDIFCSPLPLGPGRVKCAHGLLPLPAPAVLEILHDVPVYGLAEEGETVTPTGAALLKVIVKTFGPMPSMLLQKTGYGAGQRDPSYPNVLRLILGEKEPLASAEYVQDEVIVLECHLDDMNPQLFPPLLEKLMNAGALDVMLLPGMMKKGRPGYALRVLARPGDESRLLANIFAETTTLGVRYRREERFCLPRKSEIVNTSLGPVRVKFSQRQGKTVPSPEFEDCLAISRQKNLPLIEVMRTIASELEIK